MPPEKAVRKHPEPGQWSRTPLAHQDRRPPGVLLGPAARLLKTLRKRDTKIRRLSRHPLLAQCTRAELRLFSKACDEVEVRAGETLARQGWIGHWFFLIDEGSAEVILHQRRLALLEPGQYFGELALFDGGTHPATVRAASPMTLFVIHRRHFAALIDRIPSLRQELIASMVRRLRAAVETRGDPLPVLDPAFWADLPQPRRPALAARGLLPLRLRRLAWTAAMLGAVGAGMARYHPPVAVASPGATFDVSNDVLLAGVESFKPSGHYLLTAVHFDRPNVFEVIIAAVRSDREIMPIPRDADLRWLRRQQRVLFRESQMLAAAAAARLAGLKVTLAGSGALVTGLVPGSPASRVMQAGDVILAIDDTPVRIASDAGKAIRAHSSDAAVKVTFEREGRRYDAKIDRGSAGGNTDSAPVGAYVVTRDLKVGLPFEMKFSARDIGGPSAGLVYALVIADILDDSDYLNGRTIAATGTIDEDGRIGPVGGIRYKGDAAIHGDAWLFLVPSGQVDQTSGQPLLVIGVSTLREALAALIDSRI